MSIQDERIETAFSDELLRMTHEGMSKLLSMPLKVAFWQVYRRGYIRGHSARSREVQQQEEQDRREGKFPMDVEIRYEGNRLLVEGKDRTPARPPSPDAPERPGASILGHRTPDQRSTGLEDVP